MKSTTGCVFMVNSVGALGLFSNLKYWIPDPPLRTKEVLQRQAIFGVKSKDVSIILRTVAMHEVDDFTTQMEKAM